MEIDKTSSRYFFTDSMKNFAAFQTQLASIMETLTKAAVTEISKLVENGSVEIRLELSRNHTEIDCLRRELQQKDSELRAAHQAASRDSCSAGVQVVDQFEAAEGAVKGGADAPFLEQLNEKKCEAQTCDTRSDYGFAVKEEQEEEHVTQSLLQTESEDSAGRLNNEGSEYVMFERDHQLWRSFTQGDSNFSDDPVSANATKQYSRSQTIPSPIQHFHSTMEISEIALSSLENGYVVDGGVVKEEAGRRCLYSEESRSEMGDAQQMEQEQPPLWTNDNVTSQVIHPVQQQFDWLTGVAENSTDPVSSTSQNARIPRRPGRIDKKPYSCAQCQKRFDRVFHLEVHQRVHTGEKPFICEWCGKRFSLRCNLATHERIHTGDKPFGCMQCGKRFAQEIHLRTHNRVHTGEKPYRCTKCGKCFSQSRSVKTHQKIHSRDKILQFSIDSK